MNQFTKQKTFIVCPTCGEATNGIDHLFLPENNVTFPFKSGWYCNNDKCGHHFEFEIGADKQVSWVKKLEDKSPIRTVYDLLVLPPQKNPVYLVLKTKDYGSSRSEEEFRDRHYFYEEHTCPTNWTEKIESIISEGDDDPHGLFQFVLRQTKEEVEAVDAVDEEGYLHNGGGLKFMDAFFPQHSGVAGKNMGMVDEVVPEKDNPTKVTKIGFTK